MIASDLFLRETAFHLGGRALEIGRFERAAGHIEDHAVFHAVARIADIEELGDDGFAIAVGESSAGKRLAVRAFRRNLVQVHGDTARREIRMSGSHRGRAGHDAVEVERIALRHQHRFASACGASDEVGMRRRLAVVTLDDLFRQHGHASDRDVFEVERGLLILHESAIETAAGTLMAGVGGGDGETARPAPVDRPRPALRWALQRAVQAAAALLQILSGPVVGKRDGEADAVGLAVRACALSIMPSMRQCAGNAGPAGPPRAPGARPAGTISARVISSVTPGLLNFAMSEHFEFVCAKAVTCIREQNDRHDGQLHELLQNESDYFLAAAGCDSVTRRQAKYLSRVLSPPSVTIGPAFMFSDAIFNIAGFPSL